MLEFGNLLAATASGTAGSGSVSNLIFYVLLALGISFTCSILEAILLTATLSHVELSAQQGKRYGRLMKKHKESLDKPITAILTLNTIAHTVGAAGAGAEAAAIFGNEWVGLISAILTLLILIFSEIIPKTLGAAYWKQLLPLAAYTIQAMVIGLYPAVLAFDKLTAVLEPKDRTPTVTRSELEVLANVSTLEGALQEKESHMLRNLLRLGHVQVFDIMTPRTVMFALQRDMTVGEVMQAHPNLPYSRIPIYEKSTDDISAFVLRYEVLRHAAEDQHDKALHTFSRELHYVPETLSVAEVLEELVSKHEHMLLILDEYGGTAGIITLEDAIEALLGAEIVDESDLVTDMRDLARQRMKRYHNLMTKPATTNASIQNLASEVNPLQPKEDSELPASGDGL